MSLLEHLEPENAIDCWSCGGLYDLRYWCVFAEQEMLCPDCGEVSRIAEAIELTERKTREWEMR